MQNGGEQGIEIDAIRANPPASREDDERFPKSESLDG